MSDEAICVRLWDQFRVFTSVFALCVNCLYQEAECFFRTGWQRTSQHLFDVSGARQSAQSQHDMCFCSDVLTEVS